MGVSRYETEADKHNRVVPTIKSSKIFWARAVGTGEKVKLQILMFEASVQPFLN
jgi:hypothetical protein